MTCKIDGCKSEVMCKQQGVCQKHYFRMRRNGSYDLKDRNFRYESENAYRKQAEREELAKKMAEWESKNGKPQTVDGYKCKELKPSDRYLESGGLKSKR